MARRAQNEKLRQFAQKTLPVLQEHLKLAQSIKNEMPSGKRTADKPSTDPQPKTPGSTGADTTNPGMKGSGMSNPTGTDSKSAAPGASDRAGTTGGGASK